MKQEPARILVVDDDPAARYAIARVLRSDGHELIEADTGRQALELAREQAPELIVLDVRLPDMIGFDVAEHLRADDVTSSIAILQVSASYTRADAQAEGLQRGADAYLTLPLDPVVLSATVEALLRMRRAEQREKEARARAEASEQREKEARERAESNEQHYRFLADMVPQMIWTANGRGEVDYLNRRWVDFTGTGSQRPDSLDWTSTLHPDDREKFARAWRWSLESGAPLELECRRWSQPASAYRWLLIRALPMKNSSGQIVRWFGTSTDIEGQKQALAEREQLLERAHALAEERERLVRQLRVESERKDDFLAMLSHELRNPLMPVRNSVFVLRHAEAGGEQADRAIDVIDRQTEHMGHLIEELLDVTRIARGKLSLHRQSVELNGIVRRAIEDRRGQFAKTGLTLEASVQERPLWVNGDATRLTQLVGNLLQNALKFTPRGGHVSVSLAGDPGGAAIRVRDTGTGIRRELLERLFEPFVQADATLDRAQGGLGLGLALARGVTELHGGTIRAESDGPGLGAEFIVTLPIERRPSSRPEGAPPTRAGGPRRILIIEDNADSAQSLREALELFEHSVEVARDGAEGIAKARVLRPEIILCDIGLPHLDGYEVARQLRGDPHLCAAHLVALSGYALPDDIARSRAAGFDHHVAKPAQLDELQRLLADGPPPTVNRARTHCGASERPSG